MAVAMGIPMVAVRKVEVYGGIVSVRCGCCGDTVISVNRRTWGGEVLFCEGCMALPEEMAEAMILAREFNRVAWGLPVIELVEG